MSDEYLRSLERRALRDPYDVAAWEAWRLRLARLSTPREPRSFIFDAFKRRVLLGREPLYPPWAGLVKEVPSGEIFTSFRSEPLTNVSMADGVLDADDIVFTAVAALHEINGIVIYDIIGPIACILADSIATDGGDIKIVWDDGPDKIFRMK